MGKSKYETMECAMIKQVNAVDLGVEDIIKQKKLENELSRLDKELEQEIKEIKSTPIDKGLLKKQAKAELESQQKANARKKLMSVQEAEDEIDQTTMAIENLKLKYQNALQEGEMELKKKVNVLNQIKEISIEEEERKNLEAEQNYEKSLSSMENSDIAIELKIEKAKHRMEERKKDIEIKLESIKAQNESQNDKKKCWQKLYEDVKQIGLSLGDTKK